MRVGLRISSLMCLLVSLVDCGWLTPLAADDASIVGPDLKPTRPDLPVESPVAERPRIRVGIIGLDTSHALAFTEMLNEPHAADDLANCHVVAAYPQGSRDIKSSVERVPEYTKKLRERGVEIVDSLDTLLSKVDAVLLETNDGRPHLEQALPVFQAKKPCFIDKPLAGSLADAIAIVATADKSGTPIFTSSSLRYTAGAQAIRRGEFGEVFGCDAFSPCALEPTHPDLFWYGIHGVESLYTVMGPGCETVCRSSTVDSDFVVGTWRDGRVGTFRGNRKGAHEFGGTAFTAKGAKSLGDYGGYRPLVVEIVKFFRAGVPPVNAAESLEIYTFMEAADESKRQGGKPVRLADVLERAKTQAEANLKSLERP